MPNVATAQYLILVSKRDQYGKKSNSNQVGGRYKLLFAPLVLCCPLIHSMEESGQSEKRGYVDTDLSLPLVCRMIATLTKIGEGAFADVFGCQGDDWTKMALKVCVSVANNRLKCSKHVFGLA